MIIKRLLCGLIIATAVIIAIAYLVAQAYALALLAIALGTVWLFLEITDRPPLVTLFFLSFLSLAVLGNLQNLAAPVMLLGLTTNLAAWDVSRFRARLRMATDTATIRVLERNHLQKLTLALSIGFILGLFPLTVTVNISFVALVCVILLALFILRKSVLTLQDRNRDERASK